MMQVLEDGCQELREQLLLTHDLILHAHYLRQGPISVNLLAALRLAVGDEQYLRAVEEKVRSPFQVRESLRAVTFVPAFWDKILMLRTPSASNICQRQTCCWFFITGIEQHLPGYHGLQQVRGRLLLFLMLAVMVAATVLARCC